MTPEEELKTLKNSVNALRDIKEVQCSNGNWNHSSYMHGMANGLILALSLLEGRRPEYLDAPEKWVRDDPTPTKCKVSEAHGKE